MKVVLAEKPSVARELASFLGANARHEGYFEGRGYRVTWALGHLATLKEPQDYDPALKKWSLASLPFVPERFGLKLIDQGGSRKQFGVIQRLFRDADELICATDAGREGELIFRYIQELAGCVGKPARRLWLSSLTESAIRDAFARLRPQADYDALYDAARCRSEADWVVGLNATRFYTVRYRSGGQLWSVGRVQTPVLAMIARRDDEIRGFTPEPFWDLLTRYREVMFKFRGDRFAKEEDAQALLDRVRDQPFSIQGVDRRPERSAPPQLHDLTDLQREMNRRYGMSADATLKAAQALYEAKLISYPRTDSRHLSNDLKAKVPGILAGLPGDQAGRGGQARPRPAPVLASDRGRRQGRRPPRDHPDRQDAREPRARDAQGLRRGGGPPDRGVLPELRQGGDHRRRRVGRGPVPGPGGPGGSSPAGPPCTPGSPTRPRRRRSRTSPSSAPASPAPTSPPSAGARPRPPGPTPRGPSWARWRRPARWSTTRPSARPSRSAD